MCVSNRQNRTHYTRSEVRESIAAEIKSLAGYDDKCIDEDLPESLGKAGPWKVLLAAAAAKAMIDADGVTIVAYDSNTLAPVTQWISKLTSACQVGTRMRSHAPRRFGIHRRSVTTPRGSHASYMCRGMPVAATKMKRPLRRCASRKWPTHTSTNMVEWELSLIHI